MTTKVRMNKRTDNGFTIVELLIVVVVIGILAALVTVTYSEIQAKARNTNRQSDLQALQTQVEAFYAVQGYYPNNTDLNSSSWRVTNMKNLDPAALQDPKSATSVLLTAQPAANVYQYWYTPAPSTCEGAVGSGSDASCTGYSLGANMEAGAPALVKSDL